MTLTPHKKIFATSEVPKSIRTLFPSGSTGGQSFAFQTKNYMDRLPAIGERSDRLPAIGERSDSHYDDVYLMIWAIRNEGSKSKRTAPVCLIEHRLVGESTVVLRAIYTVPKYRKLGMASMAMNYLAYWEVTRFRKEIVVYPKDGDLSFISKIFGVKYQLNLRYNPKVGHCVTISSLASC
jgi:hypothetical protein